MISTTLKARLGTTAVLSALLLLSAFASHVHAAAPAVGNARFASVTMDLDGGCTPPSDLSTCAEWHKVIRENFSPREIGMLFGTATSYPEYATSYSRVKTRYTRLHDEFSAERLPAHTVSLK